MNPFATLVTQVTTPPPRVEPIEVVYTTTRTYRPVGKARAMLVHLRERKRATTRELADVGSMRAANVHSALSYAERIGVVRYAGRSVWEWCE